MGTLNTSGDNLWAEQAPATNLDYSLDWSALTSSGSDPISTSNWTADAGVTLSNQTVNGSLTSFWVTGGQDDTWYRITNTVTTNAGRSDSRDIMLYVKVQATSSLPMRSALFKNRFTAVASLRQDRLIMAANGVFPSVQVSDDYLWEKLLAAEAYISGVLRVPLAPTRYFPIQPTDADLAAIGSMPWDIDEGYDYEPDMFLGDRWGYLVTRHRPIISVQYMRFCYPSQDQGFFDLPLDWLRIDARLGHVRMIPNSSAMLMGTAGFALSTMINRRTVPDMVQISYTAGLKDAANDFPDLMDIIKKKAVLNALSDAYLPQSGSISADGLSQSMSVDMSKYSDYIDDVLNGPKGSNGGLMARINGIRSMVM